MTGWRDLPQLLRNTATERVHQLVDDHWHHRRRDPWTQRWRCTRCGLALTPPFWRIVASWLFRRPRVLACAKRLKSLMGPLETGYVQPALTHDERSLCEGAQQFLAFIAAHPPRGDAARTWTTEPL